MSIKKLELELLIAELERDITSGYTSKEFEKARSTNNSARAPKMELVF